MSQKCLKCSAEVPPHKRECPVCGTDAGFPNVRYANRPSETEALDRRYLVAKAAAKARGVSSEFDAFELQVTSSKAVMNRSLGALWSWMNGDSPIITSYYKQLDHSGRQSNGSEWDEQRAAAESAINPHCFRDLIFAALSLDNSGMTYYGNYCISFKTLTIEDRSTVFEQNPFYFNRAHYVIAGTAPPVGYRSDWPNRGKLAVAKLQAHLTVGMPARDFPSVLMAPRRDEPDCEFVEVHIFGDVNRESIEYIMGPEPSEKADKLLWKQLRRKAAELGASVEIS